MSTSRSSKFEADWSNLPFLVLVHIYSFLEKKKDQILMSEVCKNWARALDSPSLWEYVNFCFKDCPYEDEETEITEIKHAEMYSRHFRHLKICGIRTIDEQKRAKLLSFLSIISKNSQLETVSLQELYLRSMQYNAAYESAYKYILEFVKNQKTVKTVDSGHFMISNVHAVDFLNSLVNCRTLRTLKIRYIEILEHQPRERLNPSIVEFILNLENMVFQYCWIFEEFLSSLEAYESLGYFKKGKLKLIELECCVPLPDNCRGIRPLWWKLLKDLCPSVELNMRLNFCIGQTTVLLAREIQFYIVQDMPLTKFCLRKNMLDEQCDLSQLFRKFIHNDLHRTLKHLDIRWTCKSSCAGADLEYLSRFPSSCSLEICTTVSCFDTKLRTLFTSWMEEFPSNLKQLDFVQYIDNETELLEFLRTVETINYSLRQRHEKDPAFRSSGIRRIRVTNKDLARLYLTFQWPPDRVRFYSVTYRDGIPIINLFRINFSAGLICI